MLGGVVLVLLVAVAFLVCWNKGTADHHAAAEVDQMNMVDMMNNPMSTASQNARKASQSRLPAGGAVVCNQSFEAAADAANYDYLEPVVAPWFVHGLAKDDCKARVLAAATQGAFLVRASRKTPDAYAFCINLGDGMVQEDLAKPDRAGDLALYFAGGRKATPSFPDLPALVAYCQTHPLSPRAGATFKLGTAAPALNAVYDGVPVPSASDADYTCLYSEVDVGLLQFYRLVIVEVSEIYEALTENLLAPLLSIPMPSLAAAIKTAEANCGELGVFLEEARAFTMANAAYLLSIGISSEHVQTIFMYTKECNLYKKMNATLGNYGDEVDPRSHLPHYLPFAKLLQHSLGRLPKLQLVVYRGVNQPHTLLLNGAKVGDVITWWSFTSTTSSPRVLRSQQFLNAVVSIKDGQISNVENQGVYANVTPAQKTIFQIVTCSGVSVHRFSAESHEDEVLLLAGSRFRVVDIIVWRHGITEVRLQQLANGVDGAADGIRPASTDEGAFTPIDLYMTPDAAEDPTYGVVAAGSEANGVVYATLIDLGGESANNAEEC